MIGHESSGMFYLLILTVSSLLFQLSVEQAEKRHLYVKPNPTSSDCPRHEICLTLSEYLQNVSDFFASNTAIHFLPGNHTLSSSGPNHDPLFATNIHNFSFFGHTVHDTILHCTERLGFAITNSANIHISDIAITNCGQTIASLLKVAYAYSLNIHNNTKGALAFIDVYSLMLQNIRVEGSHGYGLLGVDILGDSNLINSTFTHNGWKQVDSNSSTLSSNAESPPGGNVLFVFLCPESQQVQHTLNVSQCEFSHGITDASLDFERQQTVSGGSGLGILFYDFQQNPSNFLDINIIDSIFHHNESPYGPGANMLVLINQHTRARFSIFINKCSFHNGKALEGGGMFLNMDAIVDHLQRTVKIFNSTFFHNIANTGGGFYFISKAEHLLLYGKERLFFILKNCSFSSNRATVGAGLHMSILVYKPSYVSNVKVIILECIFLKNNATRIGGGMNIYLRTLRNPKRPLGTPLIITCTSCSFVDNKAENGYAAYVKGCGQIEYLISSTYDLGPCLQAYRISIHFISTVVYKNNDHRHNANAAVLYIHNIESFQLHTSNITENNGTAIYISGSHLFIYGSVNVIGNHGYSGGGLYSDCNPQSFVHLTPHSRLSLANNTAVLHGGAIFVKDCSSSGKVDCFIQIKDWHAMSESNSSIKVPNGTKVLLENNTAEIAGNSIYGGSLETCHLKIYRHNSSTTIRTVWTIKINFVIFQSIFKIKNGAHSDMSEVTSDPFQVCFCNKNCNMNELECVTKTHIEVYRGQTFHIPAVGVGQFNNTSPAIIRTVISSGHTGKLGERQNIQELGRVCGSLSYTVRSSENATELQVSVDTISSNTPGNLQHPDDTTIIPWRPALVHVSFLNCPPGLELSSDVSTCDCEPHLKNHGIKRDTGTWIFHRPASMWMGYYRDKQVVIHPNCPFHYCKSEDANFSLSNRDEQCAFNHSGVLCGGCQEGLSLALGTSQCLKCSNVYLLLLIPFALAGVALVFLLLKCNLTVSAGSINGLIFYANIVQVNQATFFPHGAQRVSFCTKFLSVFIAWLNLDLGIQTCLFAGMDAYSKTWLQFLFPVYVWIMVGIMIYGSRYSPTVFRLIGSNAVPVLATLFLLSYAKLLRTVITAAYSTTLTGRDSSTPSVWLVDGNVPFFRGTHIALLLMALVIILVYIVPFTLFVLLAPCLQANSNNRILKKITIKLKPLLDAYQGPYKDKFRHWTGLMLLLRTILFAVFAGNVFGKPEINLFTVDLSIYLLLIYLWNAGRVYKALVWNITESFYLLNLAILTTATLLLRSLGEPFSTGQEIATDVMIGAAFAVFCAIVLYHFYACLRSTRLIHTVWRALRKGSNQKTGAATNAAAHGSPSDISAVYVGPDNVSVSHINFNQLREPLLLCSDNED